MRTQHRYAVMPHRLTRALDPAAVAGLTGSLGAWLLGHADHVSILIQWVGGLIGVAVGLVSLAIKLRQWRRMASGEKPARNYPPSPPNPTP